MAARWDTQEKIAAATSRIALSGPVRELAGLAEETKALPMAMPCMEKARDLLAMTMSTRVDAFLAFMRQDSTGDAESMADALAEGYAKAMQRCEPPPAGA